MQKILTIAWKEIYTTFSDRNLVIILLLSPLVLSTIVALAFGGLGGGDLPIQDIPIALVNQDQGNSLGLNYGNLITSVLLPGEDEQPTPGAGSSTCPQDRSEESADSGVTLEELTEAVTLDEDRARSLVENGQVALDEPLTNDAQFIEQVARAAVDQGVFTAAILIPQDFTLRMSYIPLTHPRIEATGISVYANSGSPIAAGVVRSIVEGITNQISTGNITVAATFEELSASYGPGALARAASLDMASAFACAFSPSGGTVTLDIQAVQSTSGGDVTRSILVWVGSAQAMFFALFTSTFGVLGMHNERRQWTLQRLIVSPTPKSHILAGNLIGVFMTVVFQLSALILALSIIGSLLAGQVDLIFGLDLLLLGSLVLAVALSVSGFGMLMAALVKSPEQGGIIAPVVNIAMGVLGGAFGFILPRSVSVLSIVYWGREAFQKLAADQGDIGLNLLVLVLQGGVMYVAGVLLFNRRFEL